MLPYWDWTMPQYRPDDPTNGCIIPQSFQAFLAAGMPSTTMFKALKPTPTAAQAKAFRAMAEGPDGPMLFVSQHDVLLLRHHQGRLHDVTPDPDGTRTARR